MLSDFFKEAPVPEVLYAQQPAAISARLFALIILALPVLSLGQGTLTPPGPPAPTMKTLDQIEPRKEVNPTNTPGDASNVFIINQPGSYYLAANITGIGIRNAISIQADDVTLDLRGFSIIAVPAGTVRGILVSGARRNLHVHHGTVRSAIVGIDAALAVNSIFEHLRISNNGGDGLITGAGALVESCTSLDNIGDGIQVDARSIVRQCTASGNDGSAGILAGSYCHVSNCTSSDNDAASGISVGFSSVVLGCVADSNAINGITNGANSQATMKDCSASNNGGTGIFAGNSSTVSGCTAISNTTNGIVAGGNSTVINCQARDNTSNGFNVNGSIFNCSASSNDMDGIRAFGGSSNVANCTSTSNTGNGIRLEGRSIAMGNTCVGNGSAGDAAGILSTGSEDRIEGNNVAGNDRGIEVTGAGCLIIRNSASANTSNYEIAANNRYGVILDLTAAGSAAASGNAAAGTLTTTTNPWANFAY